MSKVVLVHNSSADHEAIKTALRSEGYDVVPIVGGKQALPAMRVHGPRFVVLALNLPDIDGLEVLRAMRRDPALHTVSVIVLADRVERQTAVAVARLHVRDFLLTSSLSVQEIVQRLSHCMRNAATCPVLTARPTRHARQLYAPENSRGNSAAPTLQLERLNRGETLSAVQRSLELKPLKMTVQNVIGVTSRASCTADDVAKAVSQDQAMSVRILKAANSSVYCRGRSVNSLKTAVQRVGVSEVRKLVTTLGVMDRQNHETFKEFDLRLFWEHSLACGLMARALAITLGAECPDDYFLWGILHDSGRLLLMENLPDQYASLTRYSQETGTLLEKLEHEYFGVDHCEILGHALESWKFPREFGIPIIHHHHSVKKLQRLGPDQRRSVAIVSLANRLCHALLLGDSGDQILQPVDELVDLLGVQASALETLREEVQRETNEFKFSLLAKGADSEWPDFSSIQRERFQTVRLACISDHPDVDAIQMCLGRLAPDHAGPPNVVVLSTRTPGHVPELLEKAKAIERDEQIPPLPIVMICRTEPTHGVEELLPGRDCRLLPNPVSLNVLLQALIASCNHVLELAE